MVDGVATEPFSAIGLPPASGATSTHDKVVKVSRERYARPQSLVEDRIIRWSGVEINRPDQPAGQGTPAPAPGENDDVGDDMDWPDPVGAQPSAPTKPVESVEKTPQPSPAGVTLAEEPEQPSAHVSAAGFIPGDRPATVGATVHVEPEPVATEGPRPRISFVSHRIAEDPPRLAELVEGEAGAEKKTENAESVESKTEFVKTRHAASQESAAMPPGPPAVAAAIIESDSGNETDIEEWDDELPQQPTPKPPVTQPQPVSGPTVSLADLKQGNVAPVKFGPQQPQQSQQPGGDGQRRKRKRKRNRGGGGGMGQPGQVQPQQQQSQPQPQRPPQQPRPQPRPQPQQPQPKPQPKQPDANQVSWGDLLQ